MHHEYDIFERVDGQLVWRSRILGHEQALSALQELAVRSGHQVVAIQMATDTVLGAINPSRS
jgi:hypothetical protein